MANPSPADALMRARDTAEAASAAFVGIIRDLYGCTQGEWYRAERDDPESAFAKDQRIIDAHDAMIKALHEFYTLRDGEKGFLGKYGV